MHYDEYSKSNPSTPTLSHQLRWEGIISNILTKGKCCHSMLISKEEVWGLHVHDLYLWNGKETDVELLDLRDDW